MNEYLNYVTFADGTRIVVEEQSDIGAITHIAEDETAALAVCALATNENVSHIEFSSDEGGTYGVYDNLVLAGQPTRQNEVDEYDELTGRVIVVISLRRLTDIEIRLGALETSQAIQDGAIEDLGEVVSELAGEE